MHDLRDAVRSLRSTPIVSLLAIVSLALGIGANTAIFSILDSLLLRTLPVKEPQRLVLLGSGNQQRFVWTHPIWEEVKGRAHQFDGAFAWSPARFNLAQRGQTEFVDGLWVNGGMFDVLGVPAMLGRAITEADDRRGGGAEGPVAVISHSFWQRRFNGAADVVGRSLIVERVPFTIVGVMPPGFFGVDAGRSFDVAIPIGAEPLLRGQESVLDRRSSWWLGVMLRVKPAQSLRDGEAALRGMVAPIRKAAMPRHWSPDDQARFLSDGFSLVSAAHGGRGLREGYRQPLTIVMVVVVLVLLIACANIANLLLARATTRRHELSVRVALGASRLRIARQMIVESLLLSALGAIGGMLIALWGSRLLVRQLSTGANVSQVVLPLAIDWRMLGFTAAVAIATALLFGIAPALRGMRVQPNDALKAQGRGASGDSRSWLGDALVVMQDDPIQNRERTVHVNRLSAGWFDTYRTPLLAGRDFTPGDTAGSQRVAIVNETFARRFLGGRHPIGARVRVIGNAERPTVESTIVGYVRDAVYVSVREPVPPTMYVPYVQNHESPASMALSVRVASGSPVQLARPLAAALAGVESDLPITFAPLADRVDAALVQERLIAWLSGFFGALALLLAALGLYGLTSYGVNRRRREIGIRLALGADPRTVVTLVLRRVGVLVTLGTIAGAVVSLWATRFVATLLFGLQPRDPLTFAGAILLLAAIGATAGFLPARRASRIDPVRVLRG